MATVLIGTTKRELIQRLMQARPARTTIRTSESVFDISD
jgi:hypothetical protein